MENILANIASQVSPAAVNTPVNPGFKVGTPTHHTSLLEAFTNDVFDTTRLNTLKEIAADVTCEQFKDICKQAQETAMNIDVSSGWVKPADAKGQDAYGPVRRVLNQRLSEAKQVFGVLKAAPQVVANKGYFPALEASRQYLSQANVKWDGSKAPSDAQKAAKEQKAALGAVMDETAQEAGESLAKYMERCTSLVEAKLEEQAEERQNKAFEKLLKDVDVGALLAYMLGRMDEDSLKGVINAADDELAALQASQQA